MEKQIQFQVSDVDSALASTKRFFVSQGFKVAGHSDAAITFTRGSVMQNMVSFNPLNWKSRIVVTVLSNLLTADFNIQTTGQIVTPKEEELWNTFIQKYKVAVVENVDVSQELSKELKRTQQNTWKYVGWAFVGGIMGALPFSILAWMTGLQMLTPMGVAAGAVLFMMNRINKDRQNSADKP